MIGLMFVCYGMNLLRKVKVCYKLQVQMYLTFD